MKAESATWVEGCCVRSTRYGRPDSALVSGELNHVEACRLPRADRGRNRPPAPRTAPPDRLRHPVPGRPAAADRRQCPHLLRGRRRTHRRRTPADRRAERGWPVSPLASSTSPPARLLIDAKEVGRLLGCSWRHVLRLADQGVIPWGVKLGALRRWNLADIEAFIAGGCLPARKGGKS